MLYFKQKWQTQANAPPLSLLDLDEGRAQKCSKQQTGKDS